MSQAELPDSTDQQALAVRRDERDRFALPLEALGDMTDQQMEQVDARMARGIAFRKRVIRRCLSICEPEDFIDLGDQPYLQGCGADRIIPLLGVRLSKPQEQITEVGEDVFVMLEGTASCPMLGGQEFVVKADCSTRDPFFASEDGRTAFMQALEQVGGNRDLAKRMVLGKVVKKAHENYKSRGVGHALGIRKLTWAALTDLGFTRDRAGGRADYEKGHGKQKGKARDDLKPIAFVDALELAQNSYCATEAIVVTYNREVVQKTKSVIRVTLKDPSGSVPNEVHGTFFGDLPEEGVPDWVSDAHEQDRPIRLERVKVGTFKGSLSWTIYKWSDGDGG